ncbi:basic proline-rich protein-like [Perognathus longimembris pacificus]|uniref:basic proline-rich protein-like n=1 Tax=Perognathus longimembris pacificus TaxID=214514 RepID=UPI002018C843|nr:basic proline-rich protein-like [Perognathus longimembris pacificus]
MAGTAVPQGGGGHGVCAQPGLAEAAQTPREPQPEARGSPRTARAAADLGGPWAGLGRASLLEQPPHTPPALSAAPGPGSSRAQPGLSPPPAARTRCVPGPAQLVAAGARGAGGNPDASPGRPYPARPAPRPRRGRAPRQARAGAPRRSGQPGPRAAAPTPRPDPTGPALYLGLPEAGPGPVAPASAAAPRKPGSSPDPRAAPPRAPPGRAAPSRGAGPGLLGSPAAAPARPRGAAPRIPAPRIPAPRIPAPRTPCAHLGAARRRRGPRAPVRSPARAGRLSPASRGGGAQPGPSRGRRLRGRSAEAGPGPRRRRISAAAARPPLRSAPLRPRRPRRARRGPARPGAEPGAERSRARGEGGQHARDGRGSRGVTAPRSSPGSQAPSGSPRLLGSRPPAPRGTRPLPGVTQPPGVTLNPSSPASRLPPNLFPLDARGAWGGWRRDPRPRPEAPLKRGRWSSRHPGPFIHPLDVRSECLMSPASGGNLTTSPGLRAPLSSPGGRPGPQGPPSAAPPAQPGSCARIYSGQPVTLHFRKGSWLFLPSTPVPGAGATSPGLPPVSSRSPAWFPGPRRPHLSPGPGPPRRGLPPVSPAPLPRSAAPPRLVPRPPARPGPSAPGPRIVPGAGSRRPGLRGGCAGGGCLLPAVSGQRWHTEGSDTEAVLFQGGGQRARGDPGTGGGSPGRGPRQEVSSGHGKGPHPQLSPLCPQTLSPPIVPSS